MINRVCDEFPPSLSDTCSPPLVDFVSRCLIRDVNERWSVNELMEASVMGWSDE